MADVDSIQPGPATRDARVWLGLRQLARVRGRRLVVVVVSPGALGVLVVSTLLVTHPWAGSSGLLPPERVYAASGPDGRHLVIYPRLGNHQHATPTAVAGGPVGYVMLAAPRDEAGRPQVWASADARSWTRQTQIHGLAGAHLYDVVGTKSGFVVVGRIRPNVPAAWTSTDGRTWTRAALLDSGPHETYDMISGVEAGPSGLVAYGRVNTRGGWAGDAYLWTSRDGRRWTAVADEQLFARPNPRGRTSVGVVTYFRGRWLAAGSTEANPRDQKGSPRPACWSSPDGTHWRTVPSCPLEVVSLQYGPPHSSTRGPAGRLHIHRDEKAHRPRLWLWPTSEPEHG